MTAPLIIPRSEHNISRRDISPEALKVLYRLKECGFVAYIAGGGVRDLLLGRKPKDFDIATNATPNDVRTVFRNCRIIGRRFRLVHVFFGPRIIEVATFRANGLADDDAAPETERKSGGHRTLRKIREFIGARIGMARPDDGDRETAREWKSRGHRDHGAHATQLKRADGLILRDNVFGTPEDDARRRDFTINALFYNIDGFTVIDYVGGLADLKLGIVRSIGDPMVRYAEDPVRMLRAVRFASCLNLTIEQDTYGAIIRSRHSLAKASNARMFEEMLKLFSCGGAENAMDLLRKTGLLAVMFPQYGAWLDHSSAEERWRAAVDACRRIDAVAATGKAVRPAAMLALLFGEYHEARAVHHMKHGMHRSNALRAATFDHFRELSSRICIPKRIGEQVWHDLAHGGRPDAPHGRRHRRPQPPAGRDATGAHR